MADILQDAFGTLHDVREEQTEGGNGTIAVVLPAEAQKEETGDYGWPAPVKSTGRTARSVANRAERRSARAVTRTCWCRTATP